MTHLSILWRRIAWSRRASLGATLLGVLALLGIFAEFIAAPAPLVWVGPRGVEVLPAITEAEALNAMGEEERRARYAAGAGLWPVVRHGPTHASEAGPRAASSKEHPFGTDAHGRDLVARLVYGARTALGLSLSAVLAGMFLGVIQGGLAGIYRGFWNDRLVRLVETVDTFPAIIIVALVRAIEREPSALSLVIAVAIVRWAEIARLVRAEVLRASAEDYVMAAKALGCTELRVFYRHILPNAIGPVIVSSVFGVASVVLLEAAISFLPMGASTASASWGETLAEAARYPEEYRFLVLPGALLLLTVGGSYLLADALRDAVDPRTVRVRDQGGA
ncbi:ABC transporter permease [Chondromyces apiculatus]|uniref:Oligopeptide transport system permease protein OppC n=1 Tax=Chondromyces apiculatus DSM 436 TaxID=1192034 RepID=A0A017SY55_9BACT|nr:ABC transporter permease [Chondromyces apiculatus]EYF01697.1 Oligopeptide transport system permease protein OppC [Chondromyces apiculatus DSM 436]